MRDAQGAATVEADGNFSFEYLCGCYAVFDSASDGSSFQGVTGIYTSDLKVIVIPDAVKVQPLTLPDLGGTLLLRLSKPRQPFPMLTLLRSRIGTDGLGVTHKFLGVPAASDGFGGISAETPASAYASLTQALAQVDKDGLTY
ncbi:hypothetical protein DRW48_12385 [Paracoccus suum]|uniref:Uncharacterized protein n=2 Tax=Paracoccus suum TaxID=2259340 RepID=A0A344PLX2_9RHOB|nr:hypothetical protein DRW48_12385 [Paracoccus suum]